MEASLVEVIASHAVASSGLLSLLQPSTVAATQAFLKGITVEDCNRLKRPLEAAACKAMTSVKEASTIAAVETYSFN